MILLVLFYAFGSIPINVCFHCRMFRCAAWPFLTLHIQNVVMLWELNLSEIKIVAHRSGFKKYVVTYASGFGILRKPSAPFIEPFVVWRTQSLYRWCNAGDDSRTFMKHTGGRQDSGSCQCLDFPFR